MFDIIKKNVNIFLINRNPAEQNVHKSWFKNVLNPNERDPNRIPVVKQKTLDYVVLARLQLATH